MIIVIKKQAENRFIAFVADPKITFISGEHEKISFHLEMALLPRVKRGMRLG